MAGVVAVVLFFGGFVPALMLSIVRVEVDAKSVVIAGGFFGVSRAIPFSAIERVDVDHRRITLVLFDGRTFHLRFTTYRGHARDMRGSALAERILSGVAASRAV